MRSQNGGGFRSTIYHRPFSRQAFTFSRTTGRNYFIFGNNCTPSSQKSGKSKNPAYRRAFLLVLLFLRHRCTERSSAHLATVQSGGAVFAVLPVSDVLSSRHSSALLADESRHDLKVKSLFAAFAHHTHDVFLFLVLSSPSALDTRLYPVFLQLLRK